MKAGVGGTGRRDRVGGSSALQPTVAPGAAVPLRLRFPVGRVGIIVPTQKVVRSQDRIGI